jgi:hypothetical protein
MEQITGGGRPLQITDGQARADGIAGLRPSASACPQKREEKADRSNALGSN